mgnify:CR=1 FL=1
MHSHAGAREREEASVCTPTGERGNERNNVRQPICFWFPRSSVGIYTAISGWLRGSFKFQYAFPHRSAGTRGTTSDDRSVSGSHGPPWEPIQRFRVGCGGNLSFVCIPTRERGNEKKFRYAFPHRSAGTRGSFGMHSHCGAWEREEQCQTTDLFLVPMVLRGNPYGSFALAAGVI